MQLVCYSVFLIKINSCRYPSQQPGNASYANSHYMQPGSAGGGGYYPPVGGGGSAGECPTGYRDRYQQPGGGQQMDWSRSERDYGDYRRNDYDRRPPPANS